MPNEQSDIETFVPTQRELGLLDKRGREVPDSQPMAPPLGFIRQPSLSERIRDMVQHQLWLQNQAGTSETFEESNDFEVDDGDPQSPYEYDEDAELEREIVQRAQTAQAKKAAKAAVPKTENQSTAPAGDTTSRGEEKSTP